MKFMFILVFGVLIAFSPYVEAEQQCEGKPVGEKVEAFHKGGRGCGTDQKWWSVRNWSYQCGIQVKVAAYGQGLPRRFARTLLPQGEKGFGCLSRIEIEEVACQFGCTNSVDTENLSDMDMNEGDILTSFTSSCSATNGDMNTRCSITCQTGDKALCEDAPSENQPTCKCIKSSP